jgi:hypothetical protein
VSYCEFPEFYSESLPKAKKPHRCCECAAPIEVGEKHLYYRGKWDGEFDTGRQHMLCREVCMELNRPGREKYGECEIPFGGLWEYWQCHGWSDHEWLRKHLKPEESEAAFKMRRKIAQIKWRQRPYRWLGKRINGVWMRRKRGEAWEVIP